jgi:4-amino-4-deoxy-L-arabinose transferase
MVSGFFIILIAILFFAVAWLLYRKERPYGALLMILAGALALRIFTASDPFLHEWDEQYHALVARNLALHPLTPTLYEDPVLPYDYRIWTGNHIWLEKPPVPLWFMAASIKAFGAHEYAVRLPSIIFSVLAVWLTFLLGSTLFDKKTGLLAAFLHAINGLLIELAGGRISSDHVETCFIFFVELAILFSVWSVTRRSRYAFSMLAGIFTGLALLSKWFPALLVFPVWITAMLAYRRNDWRTFTGQLLVMAAGCIAVAAPWIIYISRHFPAEADWVIRKFLFAYSGAVEGHQAPFWYYLNKVGVLFGELIYIPLLYALWYLFRHRDRWGIWMLSAWWIIPVVVFSFGETKRQTYLLIAAPAFFLIAAWFWFHLVQMPAGGWRKWLKAAVLAGMIILPVRFSQERIKPFSTAQREAPVRTVRFVQPPVPTMKVVLFGVERPVETMFYTGITAYAAMPDTVTLKGLGRTGYDLYTWRNGAAERIVLGGN